VRLRAALAVDDLAARETLLAGNSTLCGFRGIPICDRYGIPASMGNVISNTVRVLNAVSGSDLRTADSLLARLSVAGLSEAELAALVARALTGGCSAGEGCAAAREPMWNRWRDRLEAVAESDAAQADSVRANLVELWAARDGTRAVALLERVRDPDLAKRAASTAGQRVLPIDFRSAVELTRTVARTAGPPVGIPAGMYVRLMSLGETETAAELLANAGPPGRMSERLRWAEALRTAGRVSEARAVALDALDDFDPESAPIIGARYFFRIYVELGIYNRLIDWAWALPDGPAKAGALLSVVTGVRDVG
jgi:hypothetical protein